MLRRRFAGEERGTVVVLVALTVSAMMLVAAIAIDGGAAYSERRRMQNAADAAAMAGAKALDDAKLAGTASASGVAATVQAVAQRNGAHAHTCTVIEWDGDAIGPCSDSAHVLAAGAAGVRVEPSSTRPTSFGRFAGRSTLTVATRAAATIQPVVGLSSPFVICGGKLGDGYDFLTLDGRVDAAKAAALGEVKMHGSQVPDCGAGSQMKGLNDSDDVLVPGWIDPAQGVRTGQYRGVVVGARPCPPDGSGGYVLDDCDVVIPVADYGVGSGASAKLHVVALTVWHVRQEDTGTVKHFATYRGDLTHVSDGVGGEGTVTDPNQLRVIKLIQ